MSFQLVGVYDGSREVRVPLRTKYRSASGKGETIAQTSPIGDLSLSVQSGLAALPGIGVNPWLIAGGIVLGLAGIVIGVRVSRRVKRGS